MRLPSSRLHYTTPTLNRDALKRLDEDYIASLLLQEETQFIAVSQGKTLFQGIDPYVLTYQQIQDCLVSAYPLYLGEISETGQALFALDVTTIEHRLSLPLSVEFADLRQFGPPKNKVISSYMAYAKALTHWHKTHQFCGTCGHPTLPEDAGHRRKCMNDLCGISHFPRTDPAVIMLVHDREHCLLAHNKRLKSGMYSTLAGFVEPGESFEQAVRREVMEEAGIQVGTVTYVGSQPWPFPTAMMIGFYAQATSRTIRLDDDELTDAQWFTRDDIRNFNAVGKSLPNADSISRALIQGWLDESAG